MKLKLQNNIELFIENSNNKEFCNINLVREGNVLTTGTINAARLGLLLANNMHISEETAAAKLHELRELEEDTPILVCDGQLVTFKYCDETEDGNCTIWFTNDDEYYDCDTGEPIKDFYCHCDLNEYIGKAAAIITPKTPHVAILDLRNDDEWIYDWMLVSHSYEYQNNVKNTSDIAYKDQLGNLVLFDGTPAEACRYATNYCEKHQLRLIGYDTMQENDIDARS